MHSLGQNDGTSFPLLVSSPASCCCLCHDGPPDVNSCSLDNLALSSPPHGREPAWCFDWHFAASERQLLPARSGVPAACACYPARDSGGASLGCISVLRRVVSYLATKTEEPATAAFWRVLTFILRSVCSAPYAYGLFCQSASRSWGLPLSLVW